MAKHSRILAVVLRVTTALLFFPTSVTTPGWATVGLSAVGGLDVVQ